MGKKKTKFGSKVVDYSTVMGNYDYEVYCTSSEKFFKEINSNRWKSFYVNFSFKLFLTYKSRSNSLEIKFGINPEKYLNLLAEYCPQNLRLISTDSLIYTNGTKVENIIVSELMFFKIKFFNFYRMNFLARVTLTPKFKQDKIDSKKGLLGFSYYLNLKKRTVLTRTLENASALFKLTIIKKRVSQKSFFSVKTLRSRQDNNFLSIFGLRNRKKLPVRTIYQDIKLKSKEEKIFFIHGLKANERFLKKINFGGDPLFLFLNKYLTLN